MLVSLCCVSSGLFCLCAGLLCTHAHIFVFVDAQVFVCVRAGIFVCKLASVMWTQVCLVCTLACMVDKGAGELVGWMVSSGRVSV